MWLFVYAEGWSTPVPVDVLSVLHGGRRGPSIFNLTFSPLNFLEVKQYCLLFFLLLVAGIKIIVYKTASCMC